MASFSGNPSDEEPTFNAAENSSNRDVLDKLKEKFRRLEEARRVVKSIWRALHPR